MDIYFAAHMILQMIPSTSSNNYLIKLRIIKSIAAPAVLLTSALLYHFLFVVLLHKKALVNVVLLVVVHSSR